MPQGSEIEVQRFSHRTRSALRSDQGGVAAEFVITVPAILIVLGLVLGSLMLAAQRISLVSAAGDIARLEARGDAALAGARIAELPGGTHISRDRRESLLCVTLSANPGSGTLAPLRIHGRGCATLMTDAAR